MGDLFDAPDEVVVLTSTDHYLSDPLSNVGFTAETGEQITGYRSAWWSYTPIGSGDAFFSTEYSQSLGFGRDTRLAVWTGATLPELVLVGQDDNSAMDEVSAILTIPVTAGTTYRIQVTVPTDVDMAYRLWVSGPPTLVYVAAPPIGAGVSVGMPLGSPSDTVDAAPLDVDATVPAQDGTIIPRIVVDAVPIGVGVTIGLPTLLRLSRTLMSPTGIVPTVRPVFTVAVTQYDSTIPGVYLDVQYDTTDTFTAPVTLNGNFALNRRTNSLTLTATEDLAAGDWFWRVRLRAEDGEMPWSTPAAFTVAPLFGADAVALVWTVTDGLTQPHLWQVEPSAGAVGDLITLYGQGFPDETTGGTVRFNDVVVPVTSWNTVAGTNPTAADRVIDIAGGRIDAGHDEVTLLMPELTAGVGGFTVEGD